MVEVVDGAVVVGGAVGTVVAAAGTLPGRALVAAEQAASVTAKATPATGWERLT
ncbi:MAG: hypothetical protein JO337_09660 [Acidimicrobiales bacterium]|nr:hypothetical protein [Acidimicrobiales bacterium]